MHVNLFEVVGTNNGKPILGNVLLERSYDEAFGDNKDADTFEFTFDGDRWRVDVQGLAGGCPLD